MDFPIDTQVKPPSGSSVVPSAESAARSLSVAALLDFVPGLQYATIRSPGRRGFLTRLNEALAKKIYPGRGVRGVGVAQEYLLEALLAHSDVFRFALFLERSQHEEAIRQLSSPARKIRPSVVLAPRSELVYGGVDRCRQDVWLDLTGYTVQAALLREKCSTRIYPITSVQHGFSQPHLLYDPFLRLCLCRTYPCDSLVCSTHQSRRALTSLLAELTEGFNADFGTQVGFKGRLDVVPLCVDTDYFCPRDKHQARRAIRVDPGATVLAYVGSISPLKADLMPLLRVLRELVRASPNHRLLLLLVGSASRQSQQAIESRVRELGLAAHVKMKLNVSDEAKRDCLCAADIFVSPADNIQESFGLSPVEAMACGVPQVVSDWDGYRETVKHGETGFLVPTYWGQSDIEMDWTGDLRWEVDHSAVGQSIALDCQRLRDSLQVLIENRALRTEMSIASRSRAVATYSYRSIASQYDALWQELSSMAATLGPPARARSFDRAKYVQVFGHYATAQLDDKQLLQVVEPWSSPGRALIDAGSCDTQGVALIDDHLVRRLGEILSDERPPKQFSIRELLAAAAIGGYSTAVIRRHIFWLIKQGMLRVVDGEGHHGT